MGLNSQPSYTTNALKELHDRGEELNSTNGEIEAINSSAFSFYVGKHPCSFPGSCTR